MGAGHYCACAWFEVRLANTEITATPLVNYMYIFMRYIIYLVGGVDRGSVV